jgi:hypothetical protein
MDNFHILGYPVIGYKENDDDDDSVIDAAEHQLFVASHVLAYVFFYCAPAAPLLADYPSLLERTAAVSHSVSILLADAG